MQITEDSCLDRNKEVQRWTHMGLLTTQISMHPDCCRGTAFLSTM